MPEHLLWGKSDIRLSDLTKSSYQEPTLRYHSVCVVELLFLTRRT